jgi:hypothetical protein
LSTISTSALAELRAQVEASSPECNRCASLCCTVLTIHKSGEFSFDKPGGVVCHNLTVDHQCRVFHELFELGISGCRAWSCFGAGQAIIGRHLADGGSVLGAWKNRAVSEALMPLRFVHLARLHLTEARTRATDKILRKSASDLKSQYDELALGELDRVAAVDPVQRMSELTAVLMRCYNGSVSKEQQETADSIGKLSRTRLQSLQGIDLGETCLLDVDFRGMDIRGADLSRCWYLTQQQVASARGSSSTKLSPWLPQPRWWQIEPDPAL